MVFVQKPYFRMFCHILKIFLYSETFEGNTTSDWLNQKFSQSKVALKFTKLGEKDRMFLRILGKQNT